MRVVNVRAERVAASATFPLVHRCPFVDEVDEGQVTISWWVDGLTLELHSLREWLGGFADEVVSHEELTDRIRDQVERLGLAGVAVTTRWSTAGGSVEVKAE